MQCVLYLLSSPPIFQDLHLVLLWMTVSNSDYKCIYSNPSSIKSNMHPSKNQRPCIICHKKPTRPWFFKPFVLLMMSPCFILGPSKLSLLLKLEKLGVAAIWLTLEPKFFNLSWRWIIPFRFCSSAEASFNEEVRIIVRALLRLSR